MKKTWITLGSVALICAGCETKTQSGAAGGAAIGASLDAQDRKNMEQNSPQTLHKIDNHQQLTPYDIEAMVKNGLSDEVIIDQIKATKSVFYLTSNQIIELKNAGVSERVITFMIQTGSH